MGTNTRNFNRALALRDSGKFSESLVVLRKIEAEEPYDLRVKFEIAYAISNGVSPKVGAKRYASLLLWRPMYSAAASNLGDILLGQDLNLCAALCFLDAASQDRNLLRAYDGLWRALAMLGATTLAREIEIAIVDITPLRDQDVGSTPHRPHKFYDLERYLSRAIKLLEKPSLQVAAYEDRIFVPRDNWVEASVLDFQLWHNPLSLEFLNELLTALERLQLDWVKGPVYRWAVNVGHRSPQILEEALTFFMESKSYVDASKCAWALDNL